MPKKPRLPTQISYDYIKSNYFRVVHADGAFGGISPNGNIHMSVYSERKAIPQTMVHAVEGNDVGPEIRSKRKERKAIVREVEVDVVLNVVQAEALRAWLADKIKQYQQITGTTVQPLEVSRGRLRPIGAQGSGNAGRKK